MLRLLRRQYKPYQSKAMTETNPEMIFDFFAWEILNKTSRETLQCRAAGLMAATGQIEEATDLYCLTRDYTAMVGLILSQVLSLVVQGPIPW